MADHPYLPLWTDAYLADTAHLSCLESGAYLHLLMCAWRTQDCALPNDDKKLARMAKCTQREWKKVRDAVLAFWDFDETTQKWTQKRLLREQKWVQQNIDHKRRAGQVSALKRKEIRSTVVPTEPPTEGPTKSNYPHPHPHSYKESSPYGDSSVAPNGADRPSKAQTARQMIEIWNAELGDILRTARKLNDARQKSLIARLRDDLSDDLEQWRRFCQRIRGSPHLVGENNLGWQADLDWCIGPTNFTKITEGRYDHRLRNNGGTENFLDSALRDVCGAFDAQSRDWEAFGELYPDADGGQSNDSCLLPGGGELYPPRRRKGGG